MARSVAVLIGPEARLDAGEARDAAVGAELDAVGATDALMVGPCGLALVPAPGHATAPVVVDGVAAVGEVTLYDRSRLPGHGSAGGDHVPGASADLELLVKRYRSHGPEGLLAIEGAYAVMMLDGDDLVLVRDPVGIRTLFYTRAGSTWLASTSLRAIRHWPRLDAELDLAAVRSFLSFAYLPGSETLLRGVSELLPGRCLRLRPDGATDEQVFWEPLESVDSQLDTGDHVAALRAALEVAVERRLPPSGDPSAVLLSGGIDSSLVAALAARRHDGEVRTYSIGFGPDAPNELAYAGLVAAHCKTRHRVLDVSGEAVASRLRETVGLLDCPVGDPLTVPNLMLVEAAAADGATICLNGEGGDPVFGGPKNLPMLVFEMQRAVGGTAARAEAYVRAYRKCGQDLPDLLRPEVLTALADQPHPEALMAPYLAPGRMTALLNQLLHCNLRTKGAHHILAKVERLTAARGVEGRSPLFDRSVVDLAFALPPQLKLAATVEKWILKEAVRDLLPGTIVDRPKSGMRVPVQRWLDGPLRGLAHSVLANASGLFEPGTLRAWLDRTGLILPRHGAKVWLVLTLELWLDAYDLRP